MRFQWKLNVIAYRNLRQLTHRTWVRTYVNLSYKILGETTLDQEQPPIILLHGLFGRKYLWKGIGKTILNITRRTVMIVDLRNHGSSPYANSMKYEEMAADVVHLLDKLQIVKATLIGHSIGGRTAMCTALIAPKRIASIIIVDISPRSTPTEFKEAIKILEAIKKVDFSKIKYVSKAKREAKKQLRQAVTDDTTMAAIISNIAVKRDGKLGWLFNVDLLIKHFKYITSFPKSLKGKKYDGPSLFIGGQLSEYIPQLFHLGCNSSSRFDLASFHVQARPDDLPHIRDIFPQAVVIYIPKTGHNLYVEAPTSFLEVTLTFLKNNS